MSKVAIWNEKMDAYYKNVSTEDFKSDLEKSGFKFSQDSGKILKVDSFHQAFTEVVSSGEIILVDESMYDYSDEDLIEIDSEVAVAVELK